MSMHDHESLVENGIRHYGRFASRPLVVNPRDEFRGLAGALRGWRLKEWVGFTLIHPDWFSSLILQDAQYLASSEIYAYNRKSGVLHQHAANLKGGTLGLPNELPGSHCQFARDGYQITYDFAREPGPHVLHFDIAATSTTPAFKGELVLDASQASRPLSVSSRLPGGRMYTHKAIFPIEGVLRVGEEEMRFDGTRDLAILDEHKSFLPYRANWLWGTFALHTSDGLAGANFARRPGRPGQEEESCIWSPAACEPLSEITFEPASSDPLAPWKISSRDGRLDVSFEPEGRKSVRHQFLIAAIDYFQMYGHYHGTLRGAQGTYEIKGVHGVCESMKARL